MRGELVPWSCQSFKKNASILLLSISTRVRYSNTLGSTCVVASRIVNEKTSGGYRALSTYGESAFKIDVIPSRVSRVDAVYVTETESGSGKRPTSAAAWSPTDDSDPTVENSYPAQTPETAP